MGEYFDPVITGASVPRAFRLRPSFKNKVTARDAMSAKEDEVYLLYIFASFALFAVTSLLSFY